MKKRYLAILLTLAMMLGCLAGCGGDAASGSESAEAGKQAESAAESENAGQAEADNVGDETGAEVEMGTITVWSDQYHEKEARERQIAEFKAGEGKEPGIQI